ncbi:DUF5004 domain-containing protein [Pontibacter harenae]|uniref:DUF5004 domain-containing protein n=1 Tax=Pontibacter harenae TaxID=2894083 RepID=UPI001E383F01|nr:DUF5004 domain-containing protein [Pontibacter harenae]MCC9168386.1 DUF5004 domain-containing protein [Pontibacter harenae]
MNRLRHFTLLLAFLIMLTAVSCSKENEKEDDVEPNKYELLTANTWQGNRIFIEGQDWSSLFDMDDTNMTFNKNGTYVYLLGGETNEGTWELTADDQKLLMNKNTEEEFSVDILTLTNSNLNITWEEEDEDTGGSYTIELRLLNNQNK